MTLHPRGRWIDRLVVALVGALLAPSAAADDRWPRWPTELDSIEARLRDPKSPVSARHAALHELDVYATPVIEPLVLLATSDRADDVRQAAFEKCVQRELLSCVAPAREAWQQSGTLLLRMSALKVLSLVPNAADLEVLTAALRDSDESMRGHAAQLIGSAQFGDADRERARAALMAKLADPSATVRKIAVESLGELGSGRGSLALVKLLDDADPIVREATAQTLDRFRDPRFLPAMRRALEHGGSSRLILNLLRGLANMPSDDAEPILLAAFDRPPAAVRRREVAEMLALRRTPSAHLVDELVIRLADPSLRSDVLQVLLELGPSTIEPLEQARARGLAPGLDAEIASILATHRGIIPDWTPTPEPVPTSHRGWLRTLAHPRAKRRNAALDAVAPETLTWLWHRLVYLTRAGFDDELAAPVLAALVRSDLRRAVPAIDPELLGYVHAYANDPNNQSSCLTTLVVHIASEAAVVDRSDHPQAEVRSCQALAAGLTGRDTVLTRLLYDPSPRVRQSAAYAAAFLPKLDRSLASLLYVRQTTDDDAAVRLNAAFAYAAAGRHSTWSARWVTRDEVDTDSVATWPWAVARDDFGTITVVPVFSSALGSWWIVPASEHDPGKAPASP